MNTYMEVAKWSIYVGGKLVAKMMQNLFNIRRIEYSASVGGLVRLDAGRYTNPNP